MSIARVVRAGDSSLVVEFDERIDAAINRQAVVCARLVVAAGVSGVLDVVPAFRTVTVYFDPLRTDVTRLLGVVERASEEPGEGPPCQGKTVEIPVCYGGVFGPDLDDVARFAGVSPADVVALHSGRPYRVFMLGFVPGFSYMGSVDDRIAAPRRTVPRTQVQVGSVGIAGAQTGVYPRRTPGGWNIVGRTPVPQVSLAAARPALLAAGDTVTFRAIDESEFTHLLGTGGGG